MRLNTRIIMRDLGFLFFALNIWWTTFLIINEKEVKAILSFYLLPILISVLFGMMIGIIINVDPEDEISGHSQTLPESKPVYPKAYSRNYGTMENNDKL